MSVLRLIIYIGGMINHTFANNGFTLI